MQKDEVILSICIPTYNRKLELERTLGFLIPQCLGRKVEVIVSDNASEDGTNLFCIALGKEYNFFHFFRHESNQGFAKNLISVLGQGQGQYLWMLGDDEVLHEQAIELILCAIEKKKPSWLVCNFIKLNSREGLVAYGDGELRVKEDIETSSMDILLQNTGIWASFMSINIIQKEKFYLWLDYNDNKDSDYVCFNIALYAGRAEKCHILSTPVIGRVKGSINQHRFNKVSTYLFSFFDPLDDLVKNGFLSVSTRNYLAREMFLGMVSFLLLKAKVNGQALPSYKKCYAYHKNVLTFWLVVLPVMILPIKISLGFIWVVSLTTPENISGRLKKLLKYLHG
ncbi:glycosyltransferase family 2 protein [bacterium AH-315-I20]|nr:glycosyltransferase family 2 protein [bacterium AH-315-I20]